MTYNQNKETWCINYNGRIAKSACGIRSLSQLAACELKYQNYPAPITEVYSSPTIRLRGFNYVAISKSLVTTFVMDWYMLH